MNETEGHMGKCGNSSITVLEKTYTYRNYFSSFKVNVMQNITNFI